LSPIISLAGQWFVHSGIQEPAGGVARYYRSDLERNNAVSTEITGYSISALAYLHAITGHQEYLDRAIAAGHLLTRTAWDPHSRTMAFELDPPAFAYFFDCGIVVRGLLSLWRVTGASEFLEVAAELGRSMARDFASDAGDFHPILTLPDKQGIERDAARWSRSAGCYQLKSAMAWWDLYQATGDERFRPPYERVLEYSLCSCSSFLPGHPDRTKVMDRLHAFCYFLEGLLPRATGGPEADPRCVEAVCDGIGRVAAHLREIAPAFARSDVYAQLLRVRLYAPTPLDVEAAAFEAGQLAGFQTASPDPRIHGGFYFGRMNDQWLPYVNPVSTAFALQALHLWEHRGGTSAADRPVTSLI
jgi:hypothetical protein